MFRVDFAACARAVLEARAQLARADAALAQVQAISQAGAVRSEQGRLSAVRLSSYVCRQAEAA